MESLLYSTAELAEQKQIQQIVYRYYCDHYSDVKQAFDEFKKLNTFIQQQPPGTIQLKRFGCIVFLLKCTPEGIEFHSLGQETTTFEYIKNIYQLVDYVRGLKVPALYSYSNERKFDIVMRRLKLSVKKDRQVAPDGVTYSYYRLEF